MQKIKYFLYIVLIFISIDIVNAKSFGSTEYQEVLLSFKKGMMQNTINSFSSYLSDNCYISLNNGTTGYYTTSQSYYIFENYFSQYTVFDLRFDEINKGSQSINASGIMKYYFNGAKNSTGVFVSIKNISGLWYISQIIIN